MSMMYHHHHQHHHHKQQQQQQQREYWFNDAINCLRDMLSNRNLFIDDKLCCPFVIPCPTCEERRFACMNAIQTQWQNIWWEQRHQCKDMHRWFYEQHDNQQQQYSVRTASGGKSSRHGRSNSGRSHSITYAATPSSGHGGRRGGISLSGERDGDEPPSPPPWLLEGLKSSHSLDIMVGRGRRRHGSRGRGSRGRGSRGRGSRGRGSRGRSSRGSSSYCHHIGQMHTSFASNESSENDDNDNDNIDSDSDGNGDNDNDSDDEDEDDKVALESQKKNLTPTGKSKHSLLADTFRHATAAYTSIKATSTKDDSCDVELPSFCSTRPVNTQLKYWNQRYKLFSRYDDGVRMDAEGWYSVTPEVIATHIASRLSHMDIVIDAFCGVGGNTIQFALHGQRVIAIDNDPVKLYCARHNATVYGVAHRIEFLLGDFLTLAGSLRLDDPDRLAVFLSPPWGGPGYLHVDVFDLETMIPMNGIKVFNAARSLTDSIAYFVPRNCDNNQLVRIAGEGGLCEIEQNLYNKRVKTITAYYGALVKK